MMVEHAVQPGERRPIASRDRRIFQVMASQLAAAGVTPNAISVAGMICGIASGFALAGTAGAEPGLARRALWLAAAVLVQLRLLANMLDGMVAVESGRSSPVGMLYNEIPDRISDAGTLIGAGYAAGGDPVAGLLATSVAIFTAYVRAQAKVAGAPQDFRGPMAKPHRMALMTVTAVYLALAPVSFQPAWGGHGRGLMTVALWVIVVGGGWTAGGRLSRAARHLRQGGTA